MAGEGLWRLSSVASGQGCDHQSCPGEGEGSSWAGGSCQSHGAEGPVRGLFWPLPFVPLPQLFCVLYKTRSSRQSPLPSSVSHSSKLSKLKRLWKPPILRLAEVWVAWDPTWNWRLK